MHVQLTKFLMLASLCLWLASCAQTGAPQPPSLELPKPPSDLGALRKGQNVTLTWSEPTRTTDRQAIRFLGPTRICRSAQADPTACGNPVGVVPPEQSSVQKRRGKSQQNSQPKRAAPRTYQDKLPESILSDSPAADITYAVEVLNRNERGAGLSNHVQVPAIRTPPPPTDLAAQLNEDGVLLSWTSEGEKASDSGVQHRYRIYRREENDNKETIAGEVPAGTAGPAHFLDPIEWEKTYLYRICSVSVISRPSAEVQVEGDDSPSLRVVAHDVFPPAVPAGLQAAYSGEGQKPFIDLIWAPVTSRDLAGYNVFRGEGNAAAVKINNELVKTPSYRDTTVVTGKTYVYSVSAVDVRGNESARSEQATESVP
jgi:hypothetical protein